MRYKVRKGYVFFVSRDRRLLEGAEAELTETQIQGQEYKLEPVLPEAKSEVEDKNVPKGIVRDRMVKGTVDRGVQG
jgi:hypothetical protein